MQEFPQLHIDARPAAGASILYLT